MSWYDITEDPLYYPGTNVLRNKADLTDQDELDQFEQLMFLTRSEESLPEGALDYAHYRAIHHHFFQDVYTWAGQPRQVRTAKGGNWFCYPEYIDAEMNRIFRKLADENHLADASGLPTTSPTSMPSTRFAKGTGAVSSPCLISSCRSQGLR